MFGGLCVRGALAVFVGTVTLDSGAASVSLLENAELCVALVGEGLFATFAPAKLLREMVMDVAPSELLSTG